VIRDSARIAVRAILANRLRSALTMLGLIIGVSAVIILLAVGRGAQGAIAGELEDLGTNVLTVLKRGEVGPNQTGTQSQDVELSLDDVEALEDRGAAGGIRRVVPVLNTRVTLTWRGATYAPSSFAGTTLDYLDAQNVRVDAGRAWNADEERRRERVVVLGRTVSRELFGSAQPLGQRISINGRRFEVIGLLKEQGGGGPFDEDDVILVPFEAAESNLTGAGSELGQILVQATSSDATALAERTIRETLLEEHNIDDPGDADFQIFNQARILEVANTTFSLLRLLLGAIAGISLLVGGIGVMNIMLVTVSERTREIGIRKAIGAQRRHIVGQFLLEALMLSSLGGLIGVIVGVGVGQLGTEGFQPVVTPTSVVMAFGVSMFVGLFFGSYPANRAAAMRPIDALRFE
jgi:putative ABC transport system permease protein